MNEPKTIERAEDTGCCGAAPCSAWGVVWRSRNRRDGVSTHLLRWRDGTPAIFRTRRGARDWIIAEYGYIRTRPDLRAEPHGWRLPIAVRVRISQTDFRHRR